MKPRILVVDDNPDYRLLIRLQLIRAFDVEVVEAESGVEAISKVQADNFQLIICDYMMPGFTGVEVFHYLQHHPEIHAGFIMFTAAVDSISRSEREAMIAIPKSNFPKLLNTIGSLGVAHAR